MDEQLHSEAVSKKDIIKFLHEHASFEVLIEKHSRLYVVDDCVFVVFSHNVQWLTGPIQQTMKSSVFCRWKQNSILNNDRTNRLDLNHLYSF